MTDFAIESIGDGQYDLVLTSNDFVIVGATEDTWQDELSQRIAFAVGTWLGESAFDRSVGFPWLQGVFGKQPIDGIAALVYETISGVDGVEGIVGQPIITLDTATRVLSIAVDVRSRSFVVPVTFTTQGPAA
jgi:hypothetical protein